MREQRMQQERIPDKSLIYSSDKKEKKSSVVGMRSRRPIAPLSY